MRKLSAIRVREFLLWKLGQSEGGKTLAKGTVRHVHVTLSAVLQEAAAKGLVKANVSRGLWRGLFPKGTKASRQAVEVKALDSEQAARFRTARTVAPRCYAFSPPCSWQACDAARL